MKKSKAMNRQESAEKPLDYPLTAASKEMPGADFVCEPMAQMSLFKTELEEREAAAVAWTRRGWRRWASHRGKAKGALTREDLEDRLFMGDCLEVLPRFPANSIDMVLCDLPYGTTQNKWDSVIPLDALWQEYRRVLKPGGVVVLTSQGLFTAKLILSNEAWFKYKLVWVKSKPTNFLNAKIQPLRKHEDICVFYAGRATYHPVMGEGVPYDKGIRKDQLSGSYGDFRPVRVQSDGQRYPTDVVYFKTAESEGEVWHPTQKPVALGRYLVRTFTNPGDLVLDNAFGSGSFLVAAQLEGRHCVGIEKNDAMQRFKDKPVDCLALAEQRLDEAWTLETP